MSSKLVCILKRTHFDGTGYVKVGSYIDVAGPLHFHRRTFVPLAVVIHHEPRPDHGHYTAWVQRGGSWLHFDDAKPVREEAGLPHSVGFNAMVVVYGETTVLPRTPFSPAQAPHEVDSEDEWGKWKPSDSAEKDWAFS